MSGPRGYPTQQYMSPLGGGPGGGMGGMGGMYGIPGQYDQRGPPVPQFDQLGPPTQFDQRGPLPQFDQRGQPPGQYFHSMPQVPPAASLPGGYPRSDMGRGGEPSFQRTMQDMGRPGGPPPRQGGAPPRPGGGGQGMGMGGPRGGPRMPNPGGRGMGGMGGIPGQPGGGRQGPPRGPGGGPMPGGPMPGMGGKGPHQGGKGQQQGGMAGGQQQGGKAGGKGKGKGKGSVRAGPGCNIYIYYLPPHWDEEELRRHFQHYGQVVSCTVMKKPDTNDSRGFGFVGFASKESVRRAILGMDGFPAAPGRFLSVNPKKGEEELMAPFADIYPRPGRLEAGPSGQWAPLGANIYIYHIPSEWDEYELYRHFIHYGNIASVKVMYKDDTGESRGYGFVGFERPSSALRAVAGMNGFAAAPRRCLKVSIKTGEEEAAELVRTKIMEWDSSALSIYNRNEDNGWGKGMGKGDADRPRPNLRAVPPGANLYVYNVPGAWSEEDLQQYFGPYGEIVAMTVVRNPDGTNRGYSFVGYDNPNSASQAITALNGMNVGGKSLVVKVKDEAPKML